MLRQKLSIQDYVKQLNDLSTERITESIGPAGPAAFDPDKANFASAMRELINQFASNFRRLPSFEGGGVVQAPVGAPVPAVVHGGELVIDPRTGALKVTIDQPPVVKNIDARSYFKEVPPDPHAFSKSVAFELEAAV